MSAIGHLLKKEFRQILRDPAIMRLILVMPAIQLLVLPFAADYEIKNIKIGIIDQDHSSYSTTLIHKIEYSEYFDLVQYTHDIRKGESWLDNSEVDLYLVIPPELEVDLVREKKASIQLSVNAVNGTKGNLGALYAINIIRDFNADIRSEWVQWPRTNPIPLIDIVNQRWYNEKSDYQTFMVPGILAILLTMVGSFLAAMNIVKEKEIGTIEQLNVTPIKKYEFILGKLIPFWLMGYVILTIGLIISYLVYGIMPGSNIGILYLFSGLYVFCILGLGFMVSNFTNTQQQAMMVSFFFILIFILMSGLYTPIESMPGWAQKVAWANPATYMVDAMRMILLKGARWTDMTTHLTTVGVIGIFLNSLAVYTYRKKN
jgi:ABC-2 type transport system permease protein